MGETDAAAKQRSQQNEGSRERAAASARWTGQTSTTEQVLALQSGAGNRAVADLLQPRLTVGASHDPREREAERVADQVARAPGEPAADASSVRPAPPVALRATGGAGAGVGAAGPGGGTPPPDLERGVQQAQGGGRPLPESVRTSMEGSFGADFGDVRVHEGSAAAGMASSIGAQAFTTGSDIFLGAGAGAPDSAEGSHLLAHELTHVVQQSGGADQIVRRNPDGDSSGASGDGGPPEDVGHVGATFALLEVAERLVDDLSGHRRGFLIDLKPKTLLTELKKIDQQLDKLLARSKELDRKIELLGRTAALKRRYDRTIAQYDRLKNLGGWFTKSQPLYKELRANKKAIEAEFGVKGRAKLQEAVAELTAQESEIHEELARIETVTARTHALILEVQDRAVAFGVQLEEHARVAGHTGKQAQFPFEVDTPTQLAWIETWSQKLPEVATTVASHLAATEATLEEAEKVRSIEASYEFHALSHRKLVEEYTHLSKPGTSMSHSVKITFTFGEGLEGGFFVQVSGAVAAGDDRKVRPTLSLKVGLIGKLDLGIWEVSASIGVTFSMTEGYDSLEHFAAHYMRVLSLYNGSFRRYAQLKGQLDDIPKDQEDYTRQRSLVLQEAKQRGFIEEADTIEVGTQEQRDLGELQAKAPVGIKSLTGDVAVGVGPNDEASGFAEYLSGFNFSASYTRKWFTRLVDYAEFVEANGDSDEELEHLRQIRKDYTFTVKRLDKVRADISSAVVGAVPPVLRSEEADLSNLKNLYEEGHYTFFRRGRKAFLAELDQRISALQVEEDDGRDSVEADMYIKDVRSPDTSTKKSLSKVGSVYEVAVDGGFQIGGVGVTLAGKFNKITNDANPDNDGIYFNWSLSGGSEGKVEAVDPDSDAGQSALESIADSGEFQMEAVDPTATAVSATFVRNLAGSTQEVGGVLKGGVKIEGNLVWSNGGFRTQYVRVTRSRSFDFTVKAKTGVANAEFGYSGGRTDYITEWVGNSTWTYLQTIYDGLQGHPDPEAEWQRYLDSHRKDTWKLIVASLTYTTNAKAELEAFHGGGRLFRGHFEKMSSLQHLAGFDEAPKVDKTLFDEFMLGMETCFEAELRNRKSLVYEDLNEYGWNSAEGVVDSRVIQAFRAGYLAPVGKPQVASKSRLTRGVKGSADSIEDLSRFGNYENLLDAGAYLVVKLSATKKKDLTLEFDPKVAFPKVLADATDQLATWVPAVEADILRTHANTDDLTVASRRYLDDLIRSKIKG